MGRIRISVPSENLRLLYLVCKNRIYKIPVHSFISLKPEDIATRTQVPTISTETFLCKNRIYKLPVHVLSSFSSWKPSLQEHTYAPSVLRHLSGSLHWFKSSEVSHSLTSGNKMSGIMGKALKNYFTIFYADCYLHQTETKSNKIITVKT